MGHMDRELARITAEHAKAKSKYNQKYLLPIKAHEQDQDHHQWELRRHKEFSEAKTPLAQANALVE